MKSKVIVSISLILSVVAYFKRREDKAAIRQLFL
ncbi:NilA [Xenorhabdus stockiae]|uniref:NilA n=1 Tax=Xenorhabdus stockiae TaxID=351614 RepID=A0A2D0KQZ0_9GAMM|nr:NilA [Xenorhabdus stockiae]PHM71432.1 NilA [Xenorhabdus sp. KJ12.1]